ncbi:MAG: hypothetical protein BWY99_02817 [Synergistetes bacterium ADurb.BinA166]|nr:MAG: hypothetical protein BWY99_02817 [Synergistetes bacterium ADurb.BinA166]
MIALKAELTMRIVPAASVIIIPSTVLSKTAFMISMYRLVFCGSSQ